VRYLLIVALRILIVDDEASLLTNIASFLTSFPGEFEVTTAGSAEAALEVLASDHVFDTLLTDVRMPGLDGIELVRRVLDLRPEMALVVMTAFGSAELRSSAIRDGAIQFLEKPLDLDNLRDVLLSVGPADHRRSTEIGGLNVCEVTEFVATTGETKVLQFSVAERSGTLVFVGGDLLHCATGNLSGSDAFFEMALWGDGSFVEVYGGDPMRFQLNVSQSVAKLLDEAERFRSEIFSEVASTSESSNVASADRLVQDILQQEPHSTTPSGVDSTRPGRVAPRREESQMAIKDHLEEFQAIEGFKGVAVFTAQGEMIEGLAQGKVDVKTIGMFANNALLNAQKATDQMGVGRGNLMQIRAPEAVVLMRCLNEATDFAATKEGKAHFHAVVIMDPEGNTGMATMLLDKAVAKIAEELR
jgi:FixJ family two-component response regulator/predicted regulator of Ras-like GTPase activity (Roadblock/LC7/MglB family)